MEDELQVLGMTLSHCTTAEKQTAPAWLSGWLE